MHAEIDAPSERAHLYRKARSQLPRRNRSRNREASCKSAHEAPSFRQTPSSRNRDRPPATLLDRPPWSNSETKPRGGIRPELLPRSAVDLDQRGGHEAARLVHIHARTRAVRDVLPGDRLSGDRCCARLLPRVCCADAARRHRGVRHCLALGGAFPRRSGGKTSRLDHWRTSDVRNSSNSETLS